MITRADCEALDAADDLAPLRDRFHLPDGLVYLDGNSLGALPRHVPDRVREVVERQWGEDLIRSWNVHGWVDLPRRVGDRLAGIVGAEPGSVMACDSTSVNLFKVVEASLDLIPDRRVILTDTGNFPTDLYVLGGIAERRDVEVRRVEPDAVVDALDESVGAVVLTQVDYRTGRLHEIDQVTAASHDAGALAVWDLAHSAGALRIDLAAAGVDFAVGCGYKYLNGGPGAPAFVYVAPRHQPSFHNPIHGWFGHAAPFDFSTEFVPAEGSDRTRVGTPHVLSLAALDAALDVFDDLSLDDVRAKSLGLSSLFMDLLDQRCHGLTIVTPRGPDQRGSQVSFRHDHAFEIVQALIDRGVVGDFRTPDLARFGFAPLYLRFVDVWEAVDRLAAILDSDGWGDPRYSVRSTVT